MLDEEPVQQRDLVMMRQLRSLGIEKGKAFEPDPAMPATLRSAVEEAHAGFVRAQIDGSEPWWPGAQWGLSDTLGLATKTVFSFQTADYLDIDARAPIYFLAYGMPAKLGEASFYLVSFRDAGGQLLEGGNSYRLRIPPNVPAQQFWAVTIYDLETAGFIRESPRVEVNSYDQRMQRNADGSVDVVFGPAAPVGQEANWVATAPGKKWFAMFRFYGPTPAAGQQPEATAALPADRWTVTVWHLTSGRAAMDGHAAVGGIKADVDVPAQDVLKDLSFGAMLAVDIEKGRFGIGFNGLFARVSADNKVGDIKIDGISDSGQLAILPFYRLLEWQYGVSSSGAPLRLVVAPEAGFRLTYMRTEIDVDPGRTVDGSESWVDLLIGSRIGLELTDRWAIIGEGNFGGFGVGADFTWNAQAYVGYETSLFGRPTTLLVGYRALYQDYHHNNFEWDVTMHGPVIGTAVRF